uniref:Protein Wnt n=1 Tax=Syphacia muris TaxID=451379 RepID=A0A0N5AVW9_9BILA
MTGAFNKKTCWELKGLSPGQSNICELFDDHMPAIGAGAKGAIAVITLTLIQECQYQFRNQRWNCSAPNGSGYVGPVHKLGSREAAFTYAILSSGVAHEIGRRCRLGLLRSCGCSQAAKPRYVKEEYTWGGCGDNVDYGIRFSRDFIDNREKEENSERSPNKRSEDFLRTAMNKKNNEAGRKLLKRNTKPKCKCHGVSGSCNLKTCWMQLPTMRRMGDILLEKYRTARRVKLNSRGNLQYLPDPINRDGRHGLLKRRNRSTPVELVYIDDSPDYCSENRSQGTMGTRGRICRRRSNGPDSCNVLCCGRGYHSYEQRFEQDCNCKFHWCCEVKCQRCVNTTTVDVCK